MGKGFQLLLLNARAALQRQPNQKLGPTFTGPQGRNSSRWWRTNSSTASAAAPPANRYWIALPSLANHTTIHLSYQQIRSAPAMDCTTQLGMLRERRSGGTPCSPASGGVVQPKLAAVGQPIHSAARGRRCGGGLHHRSRSQETRAAAPPAPTHQPRPAATGIWAPIASRRKQIQPQLQTLLIVSRPQHFPWRQMLDLGVDAACSSDQLGRGVMLRALEHLQEEGTCFVDPALKQVDAQRHPHLSLGNRRCSKACKASTPWRI